MRGEALHFSVPSGSVSIPLHYWNGADHLASACPWWTPGAIAFIRALIRPEWRVLELGSGGSTVFFATRCCSIISLENDLEWHNSVQKEVAVQALHHAEINLIPSQDEQITFLRNLPDEQFDCILIDSHKVLDRGLLGACALPKLKPGGTLIVDNYSWLQLNMFDRRPATLPLPGYPQTRLALGIGWKSYYFNDPYWLGKGTAVFRKSSLPKDRNRLIAKVREILAQTPLKKLYWFFRRQIKRK